jgi:hypothetical protein
MEAQNPTSHEFHRTQEPFGTGLFKLKSYFLNQSNNRKSSKLQHRSGNPEGKEKEITERER